MKKQPGAKRKGPDTSASRVSETSNGGAVGEPKSSVLEIQGSRIIVDLPAGAGRKLRGRNGAKLSVQFVDGFLIVERQSNGPRRRRT